MKIMTVMTLLFVASFASAQSEIGVQSVRVGEYIQQYAVLEVQNPFGASERRLCADSCSCTLSLQDKTGRWVFQEKDMVGLSPGLFGYLVGGDTLQPGTSYQAAANCSNSADGHWGMAYSTVSLTEGESSAAPLGASGFEWDPTGITSWLADRLSEWKLFIGDWVKNITDAITGKEKPDAEDTGFLSFLNQLATFAAKLLNVFWQLAILAWNLAQSLIKLLTSPLDWWNQDFVPVAVSFLQGVALLFFVPVIFGEVAIVGHSLMQMGGRDPSRQLFALGTTWINDHLRVFSLAGAGIFAAAHVAVGLFGLVLKALQGIKNLILPIGGS